MAGRPRNSPIPTAHRLTTPLEGQRPPTAASTAAASEAGTDGRRVRRDRNRDAVVQALLELFREGNLDPSSDEVAARSGVSARSIFRYFDDVADLAHAAIMRQQHDVAHLLRIDAAPTARTADKVTALVRQRSELFEATAMVGIAARTRGPLHPSVAAGLSETRRQLRAQVAALFAPELVALDEAAAAALLAGIDLLASFEGWQLLRLDQHLDRADAEQRLTGALARLLGT
jgi:AcrR family transcriptional regulator